MDTKLPEELTPLNLQAYFYNAFGACGCTHFEDMHTSLLRLLEWHGAGDTREPYDKLFPEVGQFYLMAGLLDNLGLSEHGTAIRYPWLTTEGRRLLAALREHSGEAIAEAEGVAYDGCTY